MENVPTELFEACLLAAEQIKASGSPRLNEAMRLVLFILGQDIAREIAAEQTTSVQDRLDKDRE